MKTSDTTLHAKWYVHEWSSADTNYAIRFYCDNCFCITAFAGNYCANCGAKMDSSLADKFKG